MSDNSSVKVAVRIRPLVANETQKGCQDILQVIDDNDQIVIRNMTDKAFTFNYVLGASTPQRDVYNRCVKSMVENLFKGYNVTILAYGQTGSGKTHSMGTAYKDEDDEEMGVIPRAVHDIFEYVRENFALDFTITVSFMELYQEVLYDLLSDKPRDQRILEIREDIVKGIHIPGLTEVPVSSSNDILDSLTRGSVGRATASTNMNAQSSRSHAIFTINICMHDKNNCKENKTAKLHLVDLAGSERPKKTGAIGNTFKEGVNINKGLFVLGNVISALGDENKANGYIPYRDSNLTRLLKDSLGGNSITLMIACVSPADYNLEETMSTLRYADRARKIKNKPIINQDPKVAEINSLKKTIQQLQLQIVGQGGPVVCPAEIELLKKENHDLKVKIKDLTLKLSVTLRDNTGYIEKCMILQNANEAANNKLIDLKERYMSTITNITIGFEKNDQDSVRENLGHLQQIQQEFNSISEDCKHVETQIREHEESYAQSVLVRPAVSTEIEPEIHAEQETHATKQIELNTELQEISSKLMIKQRLAKQLLHNVQYMVDATGLEENEAKIAALELEKNELLQLLKSVQANQIPEGSNKLSEQRKKRVKELESQIHDLNKKVQEQARLIKMKEKDEQRIKQLNADILQLKQARVKLVRNMRDESDKFRQWKLQRERELAKLKNEDRKKQNQIVQMRNMHEKQQNVFKRKVEEAVALNKRLKEVLAVRKQAQDNRNAGKVGKVENWIKHEYDVYVAMVEAEVTLAGLLEDRGTLQQQLDQLKENPETTDSPECQTLQTDIDIRSVQIQKLQNKIIDSDEENKAKTRFDNIQTMAEAKCALKTLFVQSALIKKQEVQTKFKLTDIQESQSELNNKLEKHAEEMKILEIQNSNEINNLQKTYEDKIAVLLRSLRGVKTEGSSIDEDLNKRCEIQQEKIDAQNKTIKDLKRQNEELSKKLQIIDVRDVAKNGYQDIKPNKTELNATFVLEEKDENSSKECFTPPKKNRKVIVIESASDEEEKENDDDCLKDPDWRKTPLSKRIYEDRRRFTERLTVKRSSEGGCTCKSNCSKRCGCRRHGKNCSMSCKCKMGVCANRGDGDGDNSSEYGDLSGQSFKSDEESFKKPRFFGKHKTVEAPQS